MAAFNFDPSSIAVVIGIIGGTIAADNRYIDKGEADMFYSSKMDAERFMRSAQDLHTQQTAALLDLRARELSRLIASTNDPETKSRLQGEIDLAAERMVSLNERFEEYYHNL